MIQDFLVLFYDITLPRPLFAIVIVGVVMLCYSLFSLFINYSVLYILQNVKVYQLNVNISKIMISLTFIKKYSNQVYFAKNKLHRCMH
jgi:hypothetical protein